MTTSELQARDNRSLTNIWSVLSAHESLSNDLASIQISIENAVVLLRGDLPSASLKAEVVAMVRKAGVLLQVCDCVRVPQKACDQ